MGGPYLELKYGAVVNLRVLEYVEVKGSAQVSLAAFIPGEASDAHLEGVHAGAIVLQLLVAILSGIVIMLPIVKAHVQT